VALAVFWIWPTAPALGQSPSSPAREVSSRRLPPITTEELPTTPQFQISTEAYTSTSQVEELPESLEEAWATALAVDPWLESKRYEVAAAEANWRANRAESYPWVDVGASYTVRDNEPGFVFSNPLLPGNTINPYAQREGIG
jgi:outer membrane protein TolC